MPATGQPTPSASRTIFRIRATGSWSTGISTTNPGCCVSSRAETLDASGRGRRPAEEHAPQEVVAQLAIGVELRCQVDEVAHPLVARPHELWVHREELAPVRPRVERLEHGFDGRQQRTRPRASRGPGEVQCDRCPTDAGLSQRSSAAIVRTSDTRMSGASRSRIASSARKASTACSCATRYSVWSSSPALGV